MALGRKSQLVIVEMSTHYKCLEQFDYLLGAHFSIRYLLFSGPRGKRPWRSMFPRSAYRRVTAIPEYRPHLLSRLAMYSFMLISGLRAKSLLISTGPEWGSRANSLALAIFLRPLRSKTVWVVRNPGAYFHVSHGMVRLNRLGSLANSCRAVAFESRSQESAFRARFSELRERPTTSAIIYDRYSDYAPPKAQTAAPLIRSKSQGQAQDVPFAERTLIGILGVLGSSRRDYGPLFEAIGALDPRVRERIRLVILGAVVDEAGRSVAERLACLIETHIFEGYLSESDFYRLGSECDLLVSPLSPGLGYGSDHGTGSFGDAVALKTRVALPEWADPGREFASLSAYYQDAAELSRIMVRAVEEPQALALDRDALLEFSSERVRREVLPLMLPQSPT